MIINFYRWLLDTDRIKTGGAAYTRLRQLETKYLNDKSPKNKTP